VVGGAAPKEWTADESKNQWGWCGFTTRDLKRCRLMAGAELVESVRPPGRPDRHREAITSRLSDLG
jgi:hypothetical protein